MISLLLVDAPVFAPPVPPPNQAHRGLISTDNLPVAVDLKGFCGTAQPPRYQLFTTSGKLISQEP